MITLAEELSDEWRRKRRMALIVWDDDAPVVRLRCPNCGSRFPIIQANRDTIDVLFPQCGAHEVLDVRAGALTLEIKCRVKPRK